MPPGFPASPALAGDWLAITCSLAAADSEQSADADADSDECTSDEGFSQQAEPALACAPEMILAPAPAPPSPVILDAQLPITPCETVESPICEALDGNFTGQQAIRGVSPSAPSPASATRGNNPVAAAVHARPAAVKSAAKASHPEADLSAQDVAAEAPGHGRLPQADVEKRSSAEREAVAQVSTEAPRGIDATAAREAQTGKIDSAISAETLPPAAIRTGFSKVDQLAKADKYRVSGRLEMAGTRHAKSEPCMKTLPFSPSVDAISDLARAESQPHATTGIESALERNVDEDSSLGSDNFGKVRIAESGSSAHLEGASTAAVETRGIGGVPRADISSTYKALHAVIEKTLMHPGNPTRIELELPVQDGAPVWVRLELRNGEVRTVFRTDSPDLRDALQQAWPHFSQRSQDRGLPLGEAKFESSWSQQQTPQEQQGHSRQSPHELFTLASATPRAAKVSVVSVPALKALEPATAKLSLWA
jgi:hypothetical protein